jgi:hypothetical protein
MRRHSRWGLDISTVAQLRDLALALVRLCDNGKPVVPITVNAENAQVLICDERRRAELIQQRERLLALEGGNDKHDGEAIGRETEAAAPAILPAQETPSNASAGAADGIVAQNQNTVTQPDPVFQHMQSVGRAKTWKPEEYE